MSPALSKPVRRALALALLVLLVSGLGLYVVTPVIALVTSRQEDIDLLEEQRDRLMQVRLRQPSLEATAHRLEERISSNSLLWTGPSATAVSASIQNLLRAAVLESGGQVKTITDLGAARVAGVRTISARLQIQGPVGTLRAVLERIETAQPSLFVDRLSVSAPPWQGQADQAPQLTVTLTVLGFTGHDAP